MSYRYPAALYRSNIIIVTKNFVSPEIAPSEVYKFRLSPKYRSILISKFRKIVMKSSFYNPANPRRPQNLPYNP